MVKFYVVMAVFVVSAISLHRYRLFYEQLFVSRLEMGGGAWWWRHLATVGIVPSHAMSAAECESAVSFDGRPQLSPSIILVLNVS